MFLPESGWQPKLGSQKLASKSGSVIDVPNGEEKRNSGINEGTEFRIIPSSNSNLLLLPQLLHLLLAFSTATHSIIPFTLITTGKLFTFHTHG